MSAVVESLHAVVDRYGRHTLSDPVALRAALRSTNPAIPERELALLTEVAGSGAVETLRAAVGRGQGDWGALDAATAAAMTAAPALPVPEARWACAALGTTLGLVPRAALDAAAAARPDLGLQGSTPQPPQEGSGVPTRVAPAGPPGWQQPAGAPGWQQPAGMQWDAAAPGGGYRGPGGGWSEGDPRYAGAGRAPKRRGAVIALVAASVLLLVVGATAVGIYLVRDPQTQPGNGPALSYTVDAVGERYRALGANLLDGATRCSAGTPQAGERERVTCNFADYSVLLVTHRDELALDDARAAFFTARDDSPRSARTSNDVAGFAMEERVTGAATVYWDSTQPRPASASVLAPPTVPLEDLVAWWDGRGFVALERPEIPDPPVSPLGEQFQSDALYNLAVMYFDVPGANCGPAEDLLEGEVEAVSCSWDNGVSAVFVQMVDNATLLREREFYTDPAIATPGSHTTFPWNYVDGPVEGTKVEYVRAEDSVAAVYYDQDSTSSYVLMLGSNDDLAALSEFVSQGA